MRNMDFVREQLEAQHDLPLEQSYYADVMATFDDADLIPVAGITYDHAMQVFVIKLEHPPILDPDD